MAEKIYIVDGSAYIYRAYHAVAPLTNSGGQYTHAVFGFINIMRRMLKEKKPEYLFVAWDSRGPVFRHEMYDQYKANRPPMPEDLASQLPYIKEYIKGENIASVEVPGVEADDIIATAALQFQAKGYEVVIVSGDKDLFQLVGDGIVAWDPMKNKVIDTDAVKEKYNVLPSQLLDCFALMGDSSDNVPGVPGVGPKTAQKLINQYGSLDVLYEQVDGLKKSKMKEKIIHHKDDAFLSRDLIRLKTDVDVVEDMAHYRIKDPDTDALRILYEKMGFKSLLKEVEILATIETDKFNLVTTFEQLNDVVQLIQKSKLVAIDTETSSLEARKAKLVGISLGVDTYQCWYIPLDHRNEDGVPVEGQLAKEEVLGILGPVLTSSDIVKVGHNLKYDFTVLYNDANVKMSGPFIDTMLAAYLLDPVKRGLKLDDLCREHGVELTSFEKVTEGIKGEDCFRYVDIETACNYSCEDVYGALLLWKEYEDQLIEAQLCSLLEEIEAPLIPILAEMEMSGIKVDGNCLHELEKEFGSRLKKLEKEIHELAGKEFNINSPAQLGKVLFEDLHLPHGRKTKTGYSTDIKVLEKLAPKHALAARMISYRNLAKLQSTYVEKLADLVDEDSGRVYTSFNQAVTATGRLSSSNPNMQNIPVRSEDGNRIRAAFVPAADLIFLSADYSQIDLRVMAHYSEDETLVQAFLTGADIHAKTASQVFGISEMLITPEMRRVAKAINFGIIYGMSAFGLSKQLEISRKDAQRFIDRYFDHYTGVKTFMGDVVEQARKAGFVTTLKQRRRMLPEINSTNKTRREFAERTAINTPIQGTAADIMKLAMIRVAKSIEQQNLQCKMLLQVHDEIVFELPESELDEVKYLVKEGMEKAMDLKVPLVVNFEEGKNLAK